MDIDGRMLSFKEVMELTGFGRSTLMALMKKGDFPPKIIIGKRVVRYSENAIKTWMNNKLKEGEIK